MVAEKAVDGISKGGNGVSLFVNVPFVKWDVLGYLAVG